MQNVLKNKKIVMIVAMVLMVALVAGMGAMTYSRYVSSADTPAASATVAKWGYVVSFNTENMFGANYELNADNLAIVKNDGNDVVKAQATASNFIVAPGTTGYMTINIDGVAEVLAALSIAAAEGYTDVTLDLVNGEDYQPVTWTLSDSNGEVTGCVDVSLATLVGKLASYSYTIAAGQTVDTHLTITWEWALDKGETTNEYDTILGYFAANGNTTLTAEQLTSLGYTAETFAAVVNTAAGAKNSTTINFDISATVKQIQD